MPGIDAEICVVGGGLAGLTAAYELSKAGASAMVLEAGDRLGGRVKTVSLAGCAFDVGAIGLLGSYAKTVSLIHEIGLSSRLSRGPVCMAIPREGRLQVLDLGHPLSIFRARLMSGASLWKLRKLAGPMLRHWSKLNFQSIAAMAPADIETVASFARRELNEEAYEYLISPVIRALWQRDAEDAPLIDLFWSLKAFAPTMYALEGGMQHLSDGLAAKVRSLTGVQVTAVEDTDQGARVSYIAADGQTHTQSFRACVLAVPPSIAATLLKPLPDSLKDAFAALPYSCSVNVHLALSKPIGGNVQIIFPPHSEAPDLTTVVFEHNKGPGRAPAGKGAVSLFWRDSWSRARMDADEATIVRDALEQAHRVIADLSDAQIEATHVERWGFSGVCRSVGGSAAVGEIQTAAAKLRNVVLAGDYFALSGMNAAVVSGAAAAQRLLERPPARG